MIEKVKSSETENFGESFFLKGKEVFSLEKQREKFFQEVDEEKFR